MGPTMENKANVKIWLVNQRLSWDQLKSKGMTTGFLESVNAVTDFGS
jgi:hypothetical protein